MAHFANRTIAENGTITVDYSFATLTAKPFVNKYDETHYEFKLTEKSSEKYKSSTTLDNDSLSPHSEWDLLSGVEEAALSTLRSYRDNIRREVDKLTAMLTKQ